MSQHSACNTIAGILFSVYGSCQFYGAYSVVVSSLLDKLSEQF